MKTVAFIIVLLALVAVKGLSLQHHLQVEDPSPVQQKATDDRFPAVRIPQPDGTQKLLKMDRLAVDIKVVGNLAVTTMDMRFHNGLDRILEGELSFPLGDGQTVSRFAMDVNDKLREGVVVEKAKGREVFEKIVRQNVDPGLLELTKGNTFRSRVYPIPANGYKRIVVAYEQELLTTADGLLYTLPMQFPHAIDSFSFHAEVVNHDEQPDVSRGEFTEAVFSKWQHSYRADYNAANFSANKQFTLLVPGAEKTRVVVEQHNGETFFTLALTPPEHASPRMLPRSVCLMWDASGSGATRDKERELAVLDGFFSSVGSCAVELVAFSNTPEPVGKFTVSGGNWQALRSALDSIQFDGGTQLGALDLSKYRCDEFIVVSDGISTFGESEPIAGMAPVVVVNSAQSAEHSVLRALTQRTGGHYVNLADMTDEEAVQAMTTQPYSFISAQYSDGGVAETFPSASTPMRGKGFTLAGKLLTPKATLTLNFGFGNRIVASETVVIDRGQHLASTGVTPRIWAQKKLAELDMNYKKNKAIITTLGRDYSIVTRNTSLIVLDRLEDYITYRIAPPATEPDMRAGYFAAITSEQQIKDQEKRDHIETVASMFQQRQEWWNRDFTAEAKRKKAMKDGDISRTDSLQVSYGSLTMDPATVGGTSSYAFTTSSDSSSAQTFAWTASPETASAKREEEADALEVSDSEEGKSTASNMVPLTLSAPRANSAPSGQGFAARGGRTSAAGAQEVSANDAGYFNDETFKTKVAEKDFGEAQEDLTISSMKLKNWDPQTPYMRTLRAAGEKQLYSVYLSLKQEYGTSPGFFLDVASFFAERKKTALALRILSNIAELELENHQLMRILGNRLLQLGYPRLAVAVFTDVLAIREEEPQSYRDLGLALAADGQHQRAVDTLYSLVQRPWDERFPEIELIALTEMNRIIAEAGGTVNTTRIDKRLLADMPVDMRVVLSWDADNCDMDLWITEPTGEKCYYQNRNTRAGGAMSYDLTGGYGPEEYLLKKAPQGSYKVQVNYFGDRQQRLAGPTTIQLTMFTNYGRRNETRKDITLRLENVQDVIDIGEFEFAAKGVRAVSK